MCGMAAGHIGSGRKAQRARARRIFSHDGGHMPGGRKAHILPASAVTAWRRTSLAMAARSTTEVSAATQQQRKG
jgi:hypothetical protein